ncbi:MAG: hypothetical protein JWP04_2664 [Belnapia sp.]|nr:hypothetical protein [Belnapia sp.]
MFRNTVFASIIALGAAGAAQAQDNGPRLVGGGGDGGPRIEYVVPSRNVVGGGDARLVGDSSSRSLAYSGQTQAQAPSGLVAQVIGGGNERQLVYWPAAQAPVSLAGQLNRHGG